MTNFTQTVKNELFAYESNRSDEDLCELIGYLASKNAMAQKSIEGKCDHEYLKRIKEFVSPDDFNINFGKENKGHVYIESIFKLADFLNKSDNQLKRAFLRGAFIANGSVSDPEKSYHLEIEFKYLNEAEIGQALIESLGLKCGFTLRRNNVILYIKERNAISDMLTLMGAVQSTLDFEDSLILNATRNDVNRRVNCESANMTKTIAAGLKQIEAIEKLQDMGVFEDLDKNLYDVGLLRLANPDASLNELSILMGGRLTKSGINHRLKKIIDLADKI